MYLFTYLTENGRISSTSLTDVYCIIDARREIIVPDEKPIEVSGSEISFTDGEEIFVPGVSRAMMVHIHSTLHHAAQDVCQEQNRAISIMIKQRKDEETAKTEKDSTDEKSN